MPTLESFLHYRIVDVSSIKELVAALVPPRLLQRPGQVAATTGRSPTSRRASRSCRYYRDAVFVPSPGPDSDTAKGLAAEHGGSLTGADGPGPTTG